MEWVEIGKFAIPALTLLVLALTPWFDSLIFRVLKRNPEKFDVIRHESIARKRAETKALIIDIFAEELKESKLIAEQARTAMVKAEAHEDSMRSFEESLMRQGEVLRGHIEQVFNPLTDTLTRISYNLETLASGQKTNSIAIARIEGTMAAWSGTDRRHFVRREDDNA